MSRTTDELRALASLRVAPYTAQTAHEHARIWAQLEAEGKMIGAYDLILARLQSSRDLPSWTPFDENGLHPQIGA